MSLFYQRLLGGWQSARCSQFVLPVDVSRLAYTWVGLFILVWLSACAPPPPPAAEPSTTQPATTDLAQPIATDTPAAIPPPTATEQAPIVVPISVYILDDEAGTMSSDRTVEEVAQIYERVNEIWSQANIVLEVRTIERATVPQELLVAITERNFFAFFDAVNRGAISLPSLTLVNGFYVKDLGGPNGINPSNSNLFFVMDTPSVWDERVTSHEIGHIFGLHHVLDDANRLMFSGTNGVTLNSEEVLVARYGAQGVLNRVR